jgi:vacuolar-type H+-ATPase subunit H
MESSKHRSPSVEIPVWLRSHADRPKWVSGVTPSTTCGEVLGSVLRGRGLDLSEHALVEQWRGVERPLPNSARVCQIWSAWGEERERVRFVVKRIRIRSATAAARGTVAAATASGEPVARSRRVRRRNSNGSAASVKQASDTVHPKKIRSKAANDVSSPPTSAMSKNIEDMMKIILSQGKLICEELKQMDHPMAARSYEAGLNKSLASVSSAMPPKKREKSVPNLSTASSSLDESNGDEAASLEQELEDARNLARELSRLYAINEELAASETKMHILSSNLGQLTSERCKALTTAEAEASKMRKVNEVRTFLYTLIVFKSKALVFSVSYDLSYLHLFNGLSNFNCRPR